MVLSVVPFKVKPPPSAVMSVGDATEPNSIFLSSTVSVVLLIVVVVPFTVKSHVIVVAPVRVVAPVTARVFESVTAPVTPKVPATARLVSNFAVVTASFASCAVSTLVSAT